MFDYTLRPFRAEDASAVHGLHVRHAAVDLVDVRSTLDPVPDQDGVSRAMAACDWAVVAVDAAGSVVGWGSLRSWTEGDGHRVYLTNGYVAPPARRGGLGTELLRESEAVAARLCADLAQDGPVVLGGNASTVQPDRAALLERGGYRHLFTMVEMEHDGAPLRPRRLPDDIAVRAATVADARPLIALAARAWSGRPYFRLPSEGQFRGWLGRSEL